MSIKYVAQHSQYFDYSKLTGLKKKNTYIEKSYTEKKLLDTLSYIFSNRQSTDEERKQYVNNGRLYADICNAAQSDFENYYFKNRDDDISSSITHRIHASVIRYKKEPSTNKNTTKKTSKTINKKKIQPKENVDQETKKNDTQSEKTLSEIFHNKDKEIFAKYILLVLKYSKKSQVKFNKKYDALGLSENERKSVFDKLSENDLFGSKTPVMISSSSFPSDKLITMVSIYLELLIMGKSMSKEDALNNIESCLSGLEIPDNSSVSLGQSSMPMPDMRSINVVKTEAKKSDTKKETDSKKKTSVNSSKKVSSTKKESSEQKDDTTINTSSDRIKYYGDTETKNTTQPKYHSDTQKQVKDQEEKIVTKHGFFHRLFHK